MSNEDILEPEDHDVLLGRGGGSNHHMGNKIYRALVEKLKPKYAGAKRSDKRVYAIAIADAIMAQDPPGRFLERIDADGIWYEVSREQGIDKTAQALREKVHKSKKFDERLIPIHFHYLLAEDFEPSKDDFEPIANISRGAFAPEVYRAQKRQKYEHTGGWENSSIDQAGVGDWDARDAGEPSTIAPKSASMRAPTMPIIQSQSSGRMLKTLLQDIFGNRSSNALIGMLPATNGPEISYAPLVRQRSSGEEALMAFRRSASGVLMTIGTSMSRLLGTSGGGAKNTAQTEVDLNPLFDSDEEPNSDEERLRCVRPNNSSPAPSGEWNHLYDVNFPIF